MRILHVIDRISQTRAGGSAKVPYQLGQAQARLGHDVTIYASDFQATPQDQPSGVNLVTFKTWINLFGGIKIVPGIALADFKQFDIVHLHNARTFINVIAANKGVPCVMQAHGSCLPIISLVPSAHNAMWRKVLFNKMAWFIADADAEIAQYQAEGIKRERISVIPVGIDLNEYKNLPLREWSKKKTVLSLGRLHFDKGLDVLVRAFSHIKRDDIVLKIAGIDDGYGDALRRLVKSLGVEDKVQWLGPLYGQDKIREYRNAAVFAMPSRYEMWGLTFMEALACGTPVLMSDKCEASKLLPGICGRVTPLDPEVMAANIEYMVDHNAVSQHRDMRMAWVRQFSWDRIAERTIELYQKVLNE